MKITIIGSGNLATHIAKILYLKGIKINEIFSSNIENAKILAQKVNAHFNNNMKTIKESDLYIISVTDDKINEISEKIPFKNKLVIHTSGSVDIKILSSNNRKGVIYPVQTFSKVKENIDFYNTPFCIEAENEKDLEILIKLIKNISNNIYKIDSQQRKSIHISAVFACNFTNHLCSLANDICEENNIDFSILKPLIAETIEKIITIGPKKSQTGPAKRNDMEIIKKHLEFLKEDQNKKNIYSIITNSIINYENNNN